MFGRLTQAAALVAVIVVLAGGAWGEDWPTYRHDERRSGVSAERMAPPLSQSWVFIPGHKPRHAWGDPQPKQVEGNLELPRLRFDDAFHVAADGKMVYFGSSADNTVYALDARTGEIKWQVHTGAPVRLAPTLHDGLLYVGSDDGKVYCLNAATGKEEWTFSAAPAAEMVLGNGRMISRWPVRTGVVVAGGVAYFGAGVFPADGEYLYAVNAKSGKLIWKNDTYASGGRGAISPQGYLLLSKEKLFMPSGRTKPAIFSRETGEFLYQKKLSWRRDGLFGGTYASLAGDMLYNGTEQMVAFSTTARNGPMRFTENARRWIVADKVVYLLNGKEVVAYDRAKWIAAKRKVPRLNGQIMLLSGKLEHLRGIAKVYKPAAAQIPDIEKQLARRLTEKEASDPKAKWRTPCEAVDSIVLTRGTLFAGGKDVVTGFSTKTGKQVWSAPVTGRARGLAVANGKLIVSTDSGSIHCFVKGDKVESRTVKQTFNVSAYPPIKGVVDHYATRAGHILKETGVKRGYALVLGVGSGRFAYELAKQTELMIYVVDDADEAKLAPARKALSATGMLGSRVVLHKGSPENLPYSDYFANLVVCEGGGLGGKLAAPAPELLRVLKPCGGVAVVGGVGDKLGPWVADLKKTLADRGEAKTVVALTGKRLRVTRGPLAGAGAWSHQYGGAGNTGSGDDTAVRGPLGILWYGEPGPARMPNRHRSAAAPLAMGGKMFIQGESVIFAYDAYNGVKVWEREIEGAQRLDMKWGVSNLAADEKSIFVVIDKKCIRLSQATGETLRTYDVAPPARGKYDRWKYLACVDGVLVGSRGKEAIFGLDVDSGEVKWNRRVKNVSLTSICIGDGKVFFVEHGANAEQTALALRDVPAKSRLDRQGKPISPDVRLVRALDLKSGEQQWVVPHYVSDCLAQLVRVGQDRVTKQGDITAMHAKGVLLLCGQPWNGHFWKEFFSGGFSRRSLIAIDSDDGREKWSGRIGYRSRPLIVGDTIIAEPWAHDLSTGKPKMRTHPITGEQSKWQIARPGHHCGNIAGAKNLLMFRSGTSAYYDLLADAGSAHFGAQRPGCWINSIPANGVVMLPEASSGCVCPFSVHSTVVFAPQRANRLWGMYSAAGATRPVKRLAVNFGAPGDRKDDSGELWLGYPRPRKDRLVMELKLVTPRDPAGQWRRKNANFMTIGGTDRPWIFASDVTGLSRCTIPVATNAAKAAKYTVRLYFAETDNIKRGGRVFDVAIQGKTVLKKFDIVAAADGVNKAVVKEFSVSAKDTIDIELTAKKGLTLLAAVEVIAEK